jgi:hypothetical protein
MKKIHPLLHLSMLLVAGALFFKVAGCVTAHAQEVNITNAVADAHLSPTVSGGLQQLYDAALGSTNFALAVSGGVKLADTHVKIAAVDYLYNFNENAGLLIGFDYLWGSQTNGSAANVVKGGLNLKADIQPFKNFGLTNIVATPFVAELVATPVSGTQNNGGAGLISVAGLDFRIVTWKSITLHGGGFYENRTGQGWANGNYALIHLAASRGF